MSEKLVVRSEELGVRNDAAEPQFQISNSMIRNIET